MPQLRLPRNSLSPITPPGTPTTEDNGEASSVSGIISISQSAWRMSQAFNSGRRATEAQLAPEFLDVEEALNRLVKTLKSLAECFAVEGVESFLEGIESDARDGISTILMACRRTLEGLEELVSSLQTIKKTSSAHGYSIERIWKDDVLQRQDALPWMANGRSLQDLFDTLNMHSVVTAMLISITKSRSTHGLDQGVVPIAEKIRELDQVSSSDASFLVAEIRGLANAIGGSGLSSPSLIMPLSPLLAGYSPLELSTLRRSFVLTPQATQTESQSSESQSLPPLKGTEAQKSIPTSPSLIPLPSSPTTQAVPQRRSDSVLDASVSPTTQKSDHRCLESVETIILPSPTMSEQASPFATLSKRFSEQLALASTQPENILQLAPSHVVQQYDFERMYFRNSAILFDMPATKVEYTMRTKALEEAGAMDIGLVQVMGIGRVCLVRQRRLTRTGLFNYSTSIWSFSNDMSVRLEQNLEDMDIIIPYTSYFEPTKVSITINTTLTYHSLQRQNNPPKSVNTTWVNYYFDCADSCREFQNHLFGRNLVASYRTEKTTRIYDGILSTLTASEQMCGIENFRVWEEEETGGKLATIHYSALYQQGYMMFYLNDSRWPVVVKDEGQKMIRIRGLRIPDNQFSKVKTKERGRFGFASKRTISVRMEFTTEVDKNAFLALVAEAQKEMVEIEV